MEATRVASSYSGSFCELNCLVCNRFRLPAASWLVPDPGTVCVAPSSLTLGWCSAQKRCGPRVQLPLGEQLHSTGEKLIFWPKQLELMIVRPQYLCEHSSFFLVRLTVTLKPSSRESLSWKSQDSHKQYQDIVTGVKLYLQTENSILSWHCSPVQWRNLQKWNLLFPTKILCE